MIESPMYLEKVYRRFLISRKIRKKENKITPHVERTYTEREIRMAKRRKKKKKGVGTAVFLSLVIVVCVFVLAGMITGALPSGGWKNLVADKISGAVTEKVTEQVMETAIQKALESSGDPEAASKAKEIVNNMDEEDKQTANAIIEKYADGDTISDCMDIISDGVNSESIAEVQEYLQGNVSAEDQSQLEELYKKYSQEN